MKKNVFFVGLIVLGFSMFFASCKDVDSDNDVSSTQASVTKKAIVTFDSEKLFCRKGFVSFEINSGDVVDIGEKLNFSIKDESNKRAVSWTVNGITKLGSTLDLEYVLNEFECVSSAGVLQINVDATLRDKLSPVVVFDSENFKCFKYKFIGPGESELMGDGLKSGIDTVDEDYNLKIISKNLDKIITSYSVNGGKSQTEKIKNSSSIYKVDVSIEDIKVDESVVKGGKINIGITTRDIVKAKLDFAENVVCKKKTALLNGEIEIANGSEVREWEKISFYYKNRGKVADGYFLNDKTTAETDFLNSDGYVLELEINDKVVENGNLKFRFKDHDALKTTVTFDEKTPIFKIVENGTNNSAIYTEGTATIYEGDRVYFYENSGTDAQWLSNCSVNGTPLGTRFGFRIEKSESGKLVINLSRDKTIEVGTAIVFKKPE